MLDIESRTGSYFIDYSPVELIISACGDYSPLETKADARKFWQAVVSRLDMDPASKISTK